MSFDSPAIRLNNIGKCYEIYDSPRDRLKALTLNPTKRLFGIKERVYCREFWALRNVSFEIAKGECFGVLGRNGAGKSTLLQMVAGTLTPTEGSIFLTGRVAALLELGSGFDPEFSGRDNIHLNCAILGLSEKEIAEKFDAIVTFAEIGEFLDLAVKTYSSGMLMRLAFSTAIHVDPEILIVDEALAVGDYAFQHKCMLRIKQIISKGVTVLLVTHDVGAVMANCNRALLLKNGEVQFIGPAGEVCNRYLETAAVAIANHSENVVIAKAEYQKQSESSLNLDHLIEPQPSYRWGTGQIRIERWAITDTNNQVCSTFRFRQKIRLQLILKANESISSCFPGFMLSDRNGYHLTGITNRTCGKEIGGLNAFDRILLVFEFEPFYRADNYSILVNIATDEYGTGFYDLCENIGNFTILDEDSSRPPWGYGRTYLPSSLEVTKILNSNSMDS
jgi:lipopolysaccharide transport system ATP-binding protein